MKKKIRIERDFFGNVTRYEEARSNSLLDGIFDDDEEVVVVDDDGESGEVAAAVFVGSALGSFLGSLLGSKTK